MNVRLVGGVLMVSTRSAHSSARLEVDQGVVPLGPVEIPWQAGRIFNGRLVFEAEHRASAWRLVDLHAQGDSTRRYSICTVNNWVAITDDQPALAVAAAHLFVPENLAAVDSWQDRLRAYASTMDIQMRKLPSLVHFAPGKLTLGGELLQQVGVGTINDSAPGLTIDVTEQELPAVTLDSGLTRLWVPTSPSRRTGLSWMDRSAMFDLVPGNQP